MGPTQRFIQRVLWALSPGLKRPGREAHSSPSDAEIKEGWSYTSSLPYAFTAYTERFAETYFLHLQSLEVPPVGLLGPEDGNITLLRNVCNCLLVDTA